MDLYELEANRQGFTLAQWIKHILKQELEDRRLQKQLEVIALDSTLVTRKLVEEQNNPEKVAKARQHVKDYTHQLKTYVSDRPPT